MIKQEEVENLVKLAKIPDVWGKLKIRLIPCLQPSIVQMSKIKEMLSSLQVAFACPEIKKQQTMQKSPSKDDEETPMHQKNHPPHSWAHSRSKN